jgi:predicted outer membrane protein
MTAACIVALFLAPAYSHHGNQFLSRATEMNAAEVRLGEIAMNKTQDADVKSFAEMLVADHNEVLHRLMQLRAARTTVRASFDATSANASQSGWGAARMRRTANDIPITPDHQRVVDRLSSLSGGEFDLRFINEMVRDHREAIDFFEAQTHVHGNNAARAGNQAKTTAGQEIGRLKPAARAAETYSPEDLAKDLDTADFATDTLPTLHLRLKQAEAIQKRLQKR